MMRIEKPITPSLRFVKSLQATQQVELVDPADQAWYWLGYMKTSTRCRRLQIPHLCERAECFGSVTLTYMQYQTRLAKHAFWIGQCKDCLTMFWGLARREPKLMHEFSPERASA